MARWPVTMAREERREVEEEEHAHHTPRRMSGRHAGAVPTWPARDYPGKTSPQHHRRCTHTWTTASTHSKHSEEIQRGVSSEAIEVGEILSGDRPRSHRRGEEFQIHLVEEEEGRGAHRMLKCRRRKSPEMAGICRRWRRQHRSQEGLGRKREESERGESGLGRFD
jgi:hypothetical protein